MATHVVLVHPEIHWNTGNTGRTCLAAGAMLHLIEPLGFSLRERQVRRAGLDYWEHVDPRVWPSWDAFENELPMLGSPYFFSVKAKRLLWDVPFGGPRDVVLIFGSETAGLPPELHNRVLPGGLMSGSKIVLHRTKYYEFQDRTIWWAVRDLKAYPGSRQINPNTVHLTRNS